MPHLIIYAAYSILMKRKGYKQEEIKMDAYM